MKLAKLSVLSAAVLLAGGMSLASAASDTMKSSGTSAAAIGKCWDAASNTVKDKATQSASGQKKPGAVTTGTGTSGNAINSSGPKLQTRPAGMPSC
jgi:hypothetical protein